MGVDKYEFTTYSSNEQQARTVVLVGKTGNGKSSTGNSMIGRDAFKSKFSCAGVTTICEMQTTVIENNQILNVIDTPGLFNYSADMEHIGREIVRCFDMAKDGVHAFIVVLSVKARFSREEEGVVESLRKLFGSKISSYMIVVFTGGDELGNETLDDYLGDCPKPLKETLEMCENRYVLFDNKTENEAKKYGQLQKLLALVDIIFINNGGKPYTEELFAEVKKQKSSSGNTLRGGSEQDVSAFNEQLMRITEMVESRLRASTSCLEEQLARERAARLKAEIEAKHAQMKSSEERRILEAKIERAQKKAEDAQNKFDEEMRILDSELERIQKQTEAMAKDAEMKSAEERRILESKLERAQKMAEDAKNKSDGERRILESKLERVEKQTEAMAKDAEEKANEKMRTLRVKLERAKKEAEELRIEQERSKKEAEELRMRQERAKKLEADELRLRTLRERAEEEAMEPWIYQQCPFSG